MANEKITVRLCGKAQTAMPGNPLNFRPLMWCTACARLEHMVTPEAAAMVSRLDVEQLYQRIENRSLHSTKTASGWLLICVSSLTQPAEMRLKALAHSHKL